MKPITTLVLMVLFIGIGTIAVFDPFHWKDKREEAKDKAAHVFWLKDKKISVLKITTASGVVEMECTSKDGCTFDNQGEWKITSPVQDVGDSAAIGALLSSIKNLTAVEKLDFTTPINLHEYALDTPQASLDLRLQNDATPLHLDLGTNSQIGFNVFAFSKTEPQSIYLVGDFFVKQLKQDTFHWRNKRVFPDLQSENVASLSWNEFSFVKQNGSWQMQAPIGVRANKITVEALVSTLVYLNARTISENPKPEEKKALGAPFLQITFITDKNLTKHLSLYLRNGTKREAHDYILVLDGVDKLYGVEGMPFERFNRSVLEYRDRRILTDTERDDIQHLSFEFPRERQDISLVLKNGIWEYEGGTKPSEPLSQERIKKFIAALGSSQMIRAENKHAKGRVFSERPDLILTLKESSQFQESLHFALDGKNIVLVDGETPSELRSYGQDMLAVLPVRMMDLLESGNKQVIIEDNNGQRSQSQQPSKP